MIPAAIITAPIQKLSFCISHSLPNSRIPAEFRSATGWTPQAPGGGPERLEAASQGCCLRSCPHRAASQAAHESATGSSVNRQSTHKYIGSPRQFYRGNYWILKKYVFFRPHHPRTPRVSGGAGELGLIGFVLSSVRCSLFVVH